MLDTTFLNNATRTQIEPAMSNQLYNEVVGFFKLKSKGRTKVHTSTGITFNAVVKRHEAIGLLPGNEGLATNQITPTVQGTLSPALYYGIAGITEREVILNTGGDQVKEFDMLMVQVDNLRASLQDRIGFDFYGLGTADPNGYLPLVGLNAIVGTGTYAGISGTAGQYVDNNGNTINPWSSYVDATSHLLINSQDPASVEFLPNLMYKAYYGASFEQSPADILLAVQLYQLYMNIAGDKLRLTNVEADLTFGGATFAGGTVTMSWDRHIPNGLTSSSYGRMYFLNFNRFMLLTFPGKDMQMQDPGWLKNITPANQMARFEWGGQIYCQVRREQATIQDIQFQ